MLLVCSEFKHREGNHQSLHFLPVWVKRRLVFFNNLCPFTFSTWLLHYIAFCFSPLKKGTSFVSREEYKTLFTSQTNGKVPNSIPHKNLRLTHSHPVPMAPASLPPSSYLTKHSPQKSKCKSPPHLHYLQ